MFSRRNRLSRPDFAELSSDRTAKRASSEHFSVTYTKSGQVTGCSVVVSKKIEKGSVGRHLLKRRMREVMRPFCADDVALIVYARPGSASLSFQALSDELSGLLRKVGTYAILN